MDNIPERLSAKEYRELLIKQGKEGQDGKSDKRLSNKRKKSRPKSIDDLKNRDIDAPKKNKYGAVKTKLDGIVFDSAWEAKRYSILNQMIKANLISDLQLQVKYELVVNEKHVSNYIADFVYKDSNGKTVVEDAKGVITPQYALKRKLMKAIYDIDIFESRQNPKK